MSGGESGGLPPSSAREQVSRLLALVPMVNSHGEVSLERASSALGVSVRQLKRDVERLFMCGLPGGMPDDLIEVDLDALDRSGVIRVSNADYLSRPLRLTTMEASALMVALRALRVGSGPESSAVIDRTLAKLERAAADVAPLVEPGPAEPPNFSSQVIDLVATAVSTDRQMLISYYVPSRDDQTERVIDPRGVFSAHGNFYLDAWCHHAEAPRSFRIDRIRSAQLLETRRSRVEPADESVLGLFARDPNLPRVTLELEEAAAWAIEYYPVEDVRALPDGKLEVDLVIADEAWFTRIMLRLSPHARVVAPREFATRFSQVLQATLDLYA